LRNQKAVISPYTKATSTEFAISFNDLTK